MEPDTWAEIHLNFPDPNYAAGRKKHRIFAPDFLEASHASLTPGGTISVVTDQLPFLLEMLEIANADPRFRKTHTSQYLTGAELEAKTRFQTTWERFERSTFRFELEIFPSI
jgi:tRNA G46 methylase TrmB